MTLAPDRLRSRTAAALLVSLPVLALHATAADPDPVEETVVVVAPRLPGEETPRREIPAHTTVLTRDDLERRGARTVQEALETVAGVNVHDQIGNGVETTLDLRGFAGGSGTAVYVDGARYNDPRNNAVALETIPIDAVERIEITRGSAAALAGGGSEAGVIHILTRTGGEPSGAAFAGTGSDGAGRYAVSAGWEAGPWTMAVSGSLDRDDGFRANAATDRTGLSAGASVDLGGGRALTLTAIAADNVFGAPGALTPEEMAADPDDAPFNRLDFSDSRTTQVAASFRAPLSSSARLTATAWGRDRAAESLSTGRNAAVFGGFFLDLEDETYGAAAQVSRDGVWAGGDARLSAGVELLFGEADSLGFFTPPSDPGSVDRSSPDSANATDRRTVALFVDQAWKPTARWRLSAGVRSDEDTVGFEPAVPGPAAREEREFSELSWRAGATWMPSAGVDVYASYGESFLAPSAEELFAFPLFGSNPDLAPEDATAWEIGARARRARLRCEIAGFVTDTRDEIVFDPDSPLGAFGANVNAGETRRGGVEGTVRYRTGGGIEIFADLAYTRARFREGENAGREVPLVPARRASAGLAWSGKGVDLGLRGLYVGEQVLDNDDANAADRLGSYLVVDLRGAWRLPVFPASREAGPSLVLEVRNLLDRRYATRGIQALGSIFVTPAPGRRTMVCLEWRI